MGSMFPWSTQHLHLHRKFGGTHPAFTGFLPAGLQHQGRCRTQCCRVELFSRPLRPLRGVGTWDCALESTFRSHKKSRFGPKRYRKVLHPVTTHCSSSFCIAYKSYCVNALNILKCRISSFRSRWGGHSANKGVAATVAFKRGHDERCRELWTWKSKEISANP